MADQTLDLTDVWPMKAKVRVEVTPEYVIDASMAPKALINQSASAQEGSDMKNGWIAFGILLAVVIIGLGWGYFNVQGNRDRLEVALGFQNPLPIIGVGDQRFNGLTFNGSVRAPLDRQPGPPLQGQFVDVNKLVAEASQGSNCDPQALAYSAQFLPPNTVQVRLNEGACNFTWVARN